MQVLSLSTPKARKSHKCQMCYRVIDPGETYTRQFNLGESSNVYSWINCPQCDVFLNLIEDWDGNGIGDESVMEWEPESVWEFRLKALWRKKWRRADGTLYPVPTEVA